MCLKGYNMLIKYFTDIIVYWKWFGGQTSKNDQDVRKLVLRRASMFYCAFICFMYCLFPKMIGLGPKMLMMVFSV